MSELIEIEVYAHDNPNQKLDVLNGRIKPVFMEELEGPGGGDLALSITDPKVLSDATLLDYRNVLKFRVDGKIVGGCLVGKKTSNIVDNNAAKETYQISGEGLRTWFNDAIVYPAGGLRRTSYEERAFNFASERGDWYKPAQWTAPVNVVAWGDIPGSPWRYAPAFWPDVPNAQWVWSQNSYSGAPVGDNYFRYEFTTAEDGKYAFFVAADNHYSVYIDGQLNTVSDRDAPGWTEVERIDVDLEAGPHVFGVKVENVGGPAALIAAIFRAGDATLGTAAQLITATGSAGWLVAGYPDPVPGWSPGEIMHTLLAEAEARSVRFPLWINPTFTSTHDSYGNEWPRDLDWSFGIGNTLTSVIEKLEELVCDVWIDPETLDFNMVVERGVDRSIYQYKADGVTVDTEPLVFEKGKNLLEASTDGVGEIKNSLIIQTADGWMVAQDESDSISKYGVVEAMLETGVSAVVSTAVAAAVFHQKANPEEGASYDIIPTPDHVPFVDFNVGDWVLAPNDKGLLVKRRVMSISVKEDSDNGQPIYSVEFDTIFKDNEDKLSRWMSKMGGGALGGQFANSGGGSSVPIGQPTIPRPGQPLIKFPMAPDNLSADSIGVWSLNGVDAYSQITLTWDPVTGNTDGSETVPDSYEVWGHPSEESDNTYRRLGIVFTNTAILQPYETTSEWKFKVRALNSANAPGAFSDPIEHTMVAPNEPMDAPSTPTLTSNSGVLIVSWDGLLDGLAPPPQFRYVYALVAPDVAGSPGTYARRGATLSRDGRNINISGLTVGAKYWAALVAVDGMGIESATSGEASTTLTGIDLGELGQDIQDAMDAAAEAARAAHSTTNLLIDSGFEANDPAIWSLETANVTNVTTTPRSGMRSLRIDASSGTYVASKYGYVIPVDEGEHYLFGAWVRTRGAGASDPGAVALSVAYGTTADNLTGVATIASSPEGLDSDYSYFAGFWTVPAGVRFVRPEILSTDDGGVNSYLVDDLSFRMQIPGALIVDGAVSADKIGAGQVIAGHLAAGSVAAENIQAGSVIAEKMAADSVTANAIAAGAVTANAIAAGTVETRHLSAQVGQELDISSNSSVNILVGQIEGVAGELDETSGTLQEMVTYYQFGPEGAVISSPGSPFQLGLRNDRIEMLENGNTVSYWNSGQMHVRSFVGEEVVLGNHKLEKYGTGTVVRAL